MGLAQHAECCYWTQMPNFQIHTFQELKTSYFYVIVCWLLGFYFGTVLLGGKKKAQGVEEVIWWLQ